jgi:hypothetical protein
VEGSEVSSISVQRLRVERRIERYPNHASAWFTVQGKWLCKASTGDKGGRIKLTEEWLTIERANAVAVVIGMATDWILEER